jgi:predicted AlkP superfamily pyrophosphatase or phosphodiesterase
MRRLLSALVLSLSILPSAAQQQQPARRKLLVVSVDGLDWRYLRDRDAMHLSIPNLRRLLATSEAADGVIGVFPTITWPSHTSLITGVRPDQHGIQGNRRPKSEGGDYYWSASLIRVPTLLTCAADSLLTTATITWPVTVDAPATWNLPEFFHRRDGGSMDLDTIASKATPGLVDSISRMDPSFSQQWIDDRTRTLAVLYLLKEKQPDLILVHLVDLDSEEHDQGPFTQNANAILERTDQLLGDMLHALPTGYDLALVSDHGFERIDHVANLPVLLANSGVKGSVRSLGGLAVTSDPAVADLLRRSSAEHKDQIGREIPRDELLQYAPELKDALAGFEPAPHVMFGFGDLSAAGPYLTPPQEKGDHGFWPTLPGYRSVFLLHGAGIDPRSIGEIQMLSIRDRLADRLGLQCQ